jgi:hypothetical protein
MGWDYVSVKMQLVTGPLPISQMIYKWIWNSVKIIERKTKQLREKPVPVPLCPQ